MNFYDFFMSAFEKNGLGDERRKLVKKAKGQVLELGAGTGVNLKYYDFSKVTHLTITDQSVNKVLGETIDKQKFNHKIHAENVDAMFLPFNSNFFDTVVVSLVFCTVDDVNGGLKEIRRVLKPSGSLVFIEHGLPSKEKLQPIFNGLTPLWRKLASGCHLNRDFLTSLEEAGFTYKQSKRWLQTSFVSGVAKINEREDDNHAE